MKEAIEIHDRTWWKLILIGWIALISYANLDRLLPSSHWFEVYSVHVFDSKVGESPSMDVERQVKRPFTAKWVAEVEQLVKERFVILPECTGRDENNYSIENDLPEDLDLAWWINKPCPLKPGEYRVETR